MILSVLIPALNEEDSLIGNAAFTAEELKRLRNYAYRKFYFRPEMLIRTIREVSSFSSFLSLLNFINWIKPKNR
jgi:hypothetical protein